MLVREDGCQPHARILHWQIDGRAVRPVARHAGGVVEHVVKHPAAEVTHEVRDGQKSERDRVSAAPHGNGLL